MTKTVYFEGKCYWAQLNKTDKFGNYSLQLYLDPDGLALYTKLGIQSAVKEDDKGKSIRLKRTPVKIVKGKPVDFGAPTIFDKNGQPLKEGTLIGNESTVICKVRVYDTMKGVGSTLEAVQVVDLIPFGGTVESAVSDNDFKPF